MVRKQRLNLNTSKLYGRQKETALLKGALERVESGAAEVIFLEGHSGVGKSALVQKTLAKENCFFCSGTFEQQTGMAVWKGRISRDYADGQEVRQVAGL